MDFFKKLFTKKADQVQLDLTQGGPVQSENEQPEQDEEVTAGTKIKVVAALLVVGFAAYVAYWIQEPVEVRTDVLNSSSMSQEDMGAMSQMTQMEASQTQEVSIVNFSFDPSTLNVTKGTTVVWTNKDTVPHNVVGDSFASPTLNPGESFTYTFDAEGSYAYKCTFHPQMKAYVIVGTPSGEAAKDQVLSGFGAGSSLSLETPGGSMSDAQAQSQTQETAASPAETQAPVEPAALPPEQLYTTTAQAPTAPADALHNAALQSLSTSLSNVGSATTSAENNQTSASMAADQQAAAEAAAREASMAQASESAKKSKLAGSGPEDFVYAGVFGLVLFLNRRKLRKFHKSLR